MKVAMITTWNERTSLAEYSLDLVIALRGYGVDVQVFAPEVKGKPDREELVTDGLHHCWKHGQRVSSECLEAIRKFNPDILHIQTRGGLYVENDLDRLSRFFLMPKAITFHDNVTRFNSWKSIRWAGFANPDLIGYYSDCEEWQEMPIFPGMIPAQQTAPVVLEDKFIVRTCSRNQDLKSIRRGIKHANKMGDVEFVFERQKDWVVVQDVLNFMRGAHAAICYYPKEPKNETAVAPMMALAAGKPVVCSVTDHLRRYNTSKFHEATTPKEIGYRLVEMSKNYDYCTREALEYREWCMASRRWQDLAVVHMAHYKKVLEE